MEAGMDTGLTFSIDETKIAKLVFDLPGEKVNKFSKPVFERFNEIVDQCRKNKDIKAMIFISGKKDIFVAGADIAEIERVTDRDEAERMSGAVQKVFSKLEDLPFPTIAAIHGPCLGGGLELVMAMDYRIATDDPKTKLGVPEVNLGIIPGAGGTQRIPRQVGLQAGLDLILTGKTIDAKAAKKIGLIERVVPKERLAEIAYETAQQLGAKKFKKHRFVLGSFIKTGVNDLMHPQKATKKAMNFLLEDTMLGQQMVFRKARENVLKKTKGFYPAPLKAIEAVQASLGNAKKGYAKEASLFGELAVTPICKNLIRIFYWNEAIKKDPGVEGVKGQAVEHAAVLGAGIMGGGIAQIFAHNDIRVRMKDIDNGALAKGFKAAQDVFYARVKRRKMSPRELRHKMAFITGAVKYTGFKHLDLVVEAVVENLDLKQKVLREAEAVIPAKCIFASNTSSLSITKLAAVAAHPERVIGMHFFNPVHRMPLIEVIPGKNTGKEAIATIVALAKRMGKVPIVVGDGPGFLVNRVLGIYLNEAAHLFEEGADLESIDRAMVNFGMPMGPFRLLDEVGLQTAAKAGKVLFEGLGVRFKQSTLLDTLVHDQRTGKLAGKGFYLYNDDDDGREIDRSIYELWPSHKKKVIPDEEMIERMVFLMVNEASRCLEEGIARSVRDIDMAMIMGTGFPPFRGGLMQYANSVGLARVVERLKYYEKTCGERFAPHDKLVVLAKENKTL